MKLNNTRVACNVGIWRCSATVVNCGILESENLDLCRFGLLLVDVTKMALALRFGIKGSMTVMYDVQSQHATRSSADTMLPAWRSRTNFGDRCFPVYVTHAYEMTYQGT